MSIAINESRSPNREKLETFAIHPRRGFLPEPDPLERLADEFAPWETAARDLPKLLQTGKVRRFLSELPLLDGAALRDERELCRAMVILSFFGHAFVWGERETVNSIPACLALPWFQVATSLGRPPVLSYASYVLHNWRRLDPGRPIELGNICVRQNFLGGQDEEWFVLVHVAIEAKAGDALAAILAAQQAVAGDQPKLVAEQLAVIARTLVSMHEILLRMPERCDPYIYYHRVRPYLHGWTNHPNLPDGLVYEGVDFYGGRPQSFRGETGAQSSIIPALDALLGVTHAEDMLRRYLNEMRAYMPRRHWSFIQTVEAGPSVRDFVLTRHKGYPALRDTYNAALDGVERFRSTHLEYARAYIVKQNQRGNDNPNAWGTGGTPFAPYLKKHRDETARHKIR